VRFNAVRSIVFGRPPLKNAAGIPGRTDQTFDIGPPNSYRLVLRRRRDVFAVRRKRDAAYRVTMALKA
jgi:hypothetical protein